MSAMLGYGRGGGKKLTLLGDIALKLRVHFPDSIFIPAFVTTAAHA